MLRQANEYLCQGMPANMFVTSLYAIIDPANGKIVFANAGHNLPCHLSPKRARELMARGMPLGLMPGTDYEEQQVSISEGETVLFYSDGLVEAHSPAKEMFGVPRLLQLMVDLPGESELISSLLEKWMDFRGEDGEQEDDMTLVVVRRIGVDAAAEKRNTADSIPVTAAAELAGIL